MSSPVRYEVIQWGEDPHMPFDSTNVVRGEKKALCGIKL
jgi:hypothetical protein